MSEEIDVETWLLFLNQAMSDPDTWQIVVSRLSETTGLSHEDVNRLSCALYDFLEQKMPSPN